MTRARPSAGDLLRQWRQRRRFSQLALALDAGISQRHLSFLESGRSAPSRAMLLRLADHLDMPLEARNALLLAAGFAPLFPQHDLADAELTAAREIIDRILSGHAPHPALAVDRHWTLLSANAAIAVLTDGVAGHLLAGAVNVLRLGLHPEGLAPRIVNFAEWRAHLLRRLARDIALSADPVLATLLEELDTYPAPIEADMSPTPEPPEPAVAVPLIITSPLGPLTFLSTTTMFGTATDVTLAGIAIESFFPADRQTADAMATLAGSLNDAPFGPRE